MDRKAYYGIIHQDKRSALGVTFPDFPGCVSAGDNLEELGHNAAEALQLHIDGMVDDREPIPDPSPAPDLVETNGAVLQVYATVPENAVKRYNITAKESDIKLIDTFLLSLERNIPRSTFLIECAKIYIERFAAAQKREPSKYDQFVRENAEIRHGPPVTRKTGGSFVPPLPATSPQEDSTTFLEAEEEKPRAAKAGGRKKR